MKIGHYYLDTNTNSLLLCVEFTRTYYQWIDTFGNLIDEDKIDAIKHVEMQSVRNPRVIREKFQIPFRQNCPDACVACAGRGKNLGDVWPRVPCHVCGGTGKTELVYQSDTYEQEGTQLMVEEGKHYVNENKETGDKYIMLVLPRKQTTPNGIYRTETLAISSDIQMWENDWLAKYFHREATPGEVSMFEAERKKRAESLQSFGTAITGIEID